MPIYNLLRKADLTPAETKHINQVTIDLLSTLKQEKLKIDHRREKESARDALLLTIHDFLWDDRTGLPLSCYTEADVNARARDIHGHAIRVYPTLPSPYHVAAA